MELTKEIIRDAIRKKGISELEFCDKVNYSPASLYRFYQSGQIRNKNAKRIIDFLELEKSNEAIETLKESKTQTKVYQNANDETMFDRLLRRIEELTVENFTLKRELGKFSSVSFHPALAS